MQLSWTPETLAITLPLMAKGLIGIFAVIIVIWLVIALLNRLTAPKDPQS